MAQLAEIQQTSENLTQPLPNLGIASKSELELYLIEGELGLTRAFRQQILINKRGIEGSPVILDLPAFYYLVSRQYNSKLICNKSTNGMVYHHTCTVGGLDFVCHTLQPLNIPGYR